MKRRMVSLTLALCLCLSLMPAAWAAEAPPASYTTPSGLTIHVTRPVGTLDDTSLTYMGDGVFQVREENGTYGLYDINGARLGQLGDVFLLGDFQDGLCPVRVYDVYTAENKCGYIDRTGQLAIAAQYQEVKDFSEGYAAVKNENGWGYIDTSGNLVVPCQYQMAYPFQDGEAVVEYHTQVQTFQYTRHKYIDTANRTIREFPSHMEDVAVGLGTISVPMDDCTPEAGGIFMEGKMLVMETRSAQYGLMDRSNHIQLFPGLTKDPEVTVLEYLGGDRFFVSKLSRRAVLNSDGEVIFPYIYFYYDMREFDTDTGLAVVGDAMEHGLLDTDGNYVIPMTTNWYMLTNFQDGISVGSWYNPSGASIPYILRIDGITAPEPEPQPDVPSSWAAEQVNQAISAGLVPLSLQAQYTTPATRAEFCALAVELYETVTGSEITEWATFSDTTDVNVQKMAGLGVVTGVGNGAFHPEGTLTREQAATMLSRLAAAMGKPLTAAAPTFADNASIASWAVDAVGQMQISGVMGGTGNNSFTPQGSYTREQSILTILRLYNLVK